MNNTDKLLDVIAALLATNVVPTNVRHVDQEAGYRARSWAHTYLEQAGRA